MIDSFIQTFISSMQMMPAEIPSLLTFMVCCLAIYGACKMGYAGLCTYNVVAIFLGNIQALQQGLYLTTPEPVALGTILFATTFLVCDIITENYGAAYARRCTMLCFASQLCIVMLMVLSLGHKMPQTKDQTDILSCLTIIFVPQIRFFAASLISFLVSQFADISIYQYIRRLTGEKHLWVRQNVSTFLSGVLDTVIFSLLAWIVFSPTPLPLRTVIITYILSGHLMRILVNFAGTALVYKSKHWIKPH